MLYFGACLVSSKGFSEVQVTIHIIQKDNGKMQYKRGVHGFYKIVLSCFDVPLSVLMSV
jgi:hypothetical protein